MSRGLILASAVLAAVFSPYAAYSASFSIVDGEGFESPSYSTTFNGTGQLEGQFASTAGGFGSIQWTQAGGSTSSAVVQSSVVASGDQAVQVDKGAGEDGFWGVLQAGYPDPSRPYICIEWDMLVEQTTPNPTAPFGPYFGVVAYGNDSGQKRLGYAGVDSQTGEVLYSTSVDGFFQPATKANGDPLLATFGQWHSFQLVLDYTTMTYSGSFDGVPYLTGAEISEGFVDSVAALFTDADISAISAADTPEYNAVTGTAYFDNFVVFETDINKIPEPTAFALAFLGLGVAAGRVRR